MPENLQRKHATNIGENRGNWGKREKRGNGVNIWEKMKKSEKEDNFNKMAKARIEKILLLCPSSQKGLATFCSMCIYKA